MIDSGRKPWPWFAPLLGSYVPLHIAASNPGQVDAGEAAIVTGIALVVSGALVALVRPVLRNWSAAGLGAAWLILLFYGYGPVNVWWVDFANESLEQSVRGMRWLYGNAQPAHSLVWTVIACGGLWALRSVGAAPAARLAAALNVAAVFLAAVALLRLVSGNFDRDGQHGTSPAPPAARTAATGAPAPDIYLILLDAYARADVLAEHYGFDNSRFVDELRRSGFQVSGESRANFYWTFLSLATMLNMEYVQALLGERLDPESRDRFDAYRMLRDNRAAAFLRARGYRTVQLQSTWSGMGRNPYVDEFVPCESGFLTSNYLRSIADASWLRAAQARASLEIASCHLRNFESLAAQASRPGPKFVVAHFVPPHHPYLFDRAGRVLRRATISDQFDFQQRLWEDRRAYVDQLSYVNDRVLEVVRRLITESRTPPVIILVSDHGPKPMSGLGELEARRIGFATLTAMHVPGAPADFLPADATPVNHLRRIFNLYFDAGLPLAPDRHFVSSYQMPYDLREVDTEGRLLPASNADF